jgi:hypothetical protein
VEALLVVWRDAHAYRDRWIGPEDIDPEPCVVRSVGWALADAKPDHLVLIQSANSDGDFDGCLCIPRGMIVSVRVLSGWADSS